MYTVGKIDLQTFAWFRAWTLSGSREKSGKMGKNKETNGGARACARRGVAIFVGKHAITN